MKIFRLVPVSVLCGIFAIPLFAEVNENAQAVNKAKTLISSGKTVEAVPILSPIVKKKFRKTEGAQAAVLLAECALRNGDKALAQKLSSNFLEYYVNSPYRERMETISAIIKIESGEVFDGVETLLRVMAYSKNPVSRARAREVTIQTLASSLMSAAELQTLLDKYAVDKDINGWIELQLGRESQNERRYKAARYWYKKVLAREGISNRLAETAKKGIESLEGQGAGRPTLLILAPLSGEFSEFGGQAVHGVILALEQSGQKDKLNVRIADTRADAFTALRQTQKALNQDSVIAVIGPIMSAPAATVAAWIGSNFPKIPMITPTATDDGIAQMGGNVFQLNITMHHLAKSIADYAMDCFGIREFAVVSPLGDYGNSMTNSFTRTVESRGGKVIALQNYAEGRNDYKTEFDLMRSIRFSQENRKKNIALGAENLNAVNSRERKAYLQDSVARFPAIFMPATNPADAGAMASQMAFHKVGGLLLGTSGWYGRDLLINGKNLVNGAFFSVPASDVSEEGNYATFKNAFVEKWGVEPGEDKVAVLSYDAANIILKTQPKSDETLVSAIRKKGTFVGALGEIRFKNGANINSKIASVEKNRIVFMNGCPVDEETSDSTATAKPTK